MEKINCRRCHREIDAEDHFCRHCGLQLKTVEMDGWAAAEVVHGLPTVRRSYADNPWLVLILLFFALGPLGLPILWKSRAFNRGGKWIWTLVVLLSTALACWLLWVVTVKMIVEPLRELRF